MGFLASVARGVKAIATAARQALTAPEFDEILEYDIYGRLVFEVAIVNATPVRLTRSGQLIPNHVPSTLWG